MKRMMLIGLVAILVLTMSMPALAGGTLSCGGGGYAYTCGYDAVGYAHHQLLTQQETVYQSGTNVKNWGFRSGSPSWDVWGPISGENGACYT